MSLSVDMILGVEIPECPLGHRGSVVRAGWYGRAGQRRQRWLCRPVEGEPHRFAEVLPRIVASAAEHVCADCATQLEPWEGQPAPRLYGFAARDVAHALALVAGGASYRATAAAVRTAAGRAEHRADPERKGSPAAAGERPCRAGVGLGRGVRAVALGGVRPRRVAVSASAGLGRVPPRQPRQGPRRGGVLGPGRDGLRLRRPVVCGRDRGGPERYPGRVANVPAPPGGPPRLGRHRRRARTGRRHRRRGRPGAAARRAARSRLSRADRAARDHGAALRMAPGPQPHQLPARPGTARPHRPDPHPDRPGPVQPGRLATARTRAPRPATRYRQLRPDPHPARRPRRAGPGPDRHPRPSRTEHHRRARGVLPPTRRDHRRPRREPDQQGPRRGPLEAHRRPPQRLDQRDPLGRTHPRPPHPTPRPRPTATPAQRPQSSPEPPLTVSTLSDIGHLFYSRRMAGVGEAWLDEAEAASALFDADLPPLPRDPDFPDPAVFAARVDAWDAGRIPLPGDPGPSVRRPHRQPEPDGVVSPDPDDLDAGDLIPFRPGPASRIDVLEWELCGADERDEAEAAMLAARAPGWVRLPPGGGLAAALEGVRPSVESPVALIEVMRACDRQVAWLESVKVAAVAAFTAHRAREAATEPYARVVDNATGRPMDPARSCAAE